MTYVTHCTGVPGWTIHSTCSFPGTDVPGYFHSPLFGAHESYFLPTQTLRSSFRFAQAGLKPCPTSFDHEGQERTRRKAKTGSESQLVIDACAISH